MLKQNTARKPIIHNLLMTHKFDCWNYCHDLEFRSFFFFVSRVHWLAFLSNFYSPLNGRSTYINTKTILLQYEKQKTTTRHTDNLTKQKHYNQ